MTTNLVSTITQYLSPDLVARVASSFGIEQSSIQKAVMAGVPGLLAALSSLASTPGGAAKLADAVSQQDSSILGSLGSIVGGSGQTAMSNAGGDVLRSVLGGNVVSSLAGAIGKYAGIGQQPAASLMGLLGPVVMSVLGQQQRGRDATGLQTLFASQSANIAGALPASVSKALSGTGILDGIGGYVEDMPREAVGRAYQAVSEPMRQGTKAVERNWILPALAVLGLGLLGWYFVSGPNPTKTVEQKYSTAADSRIVTGAVEIPRLEASKIFAPLSGVKAGDVDLGAQLTSVVDSLQSSLEGIKDEATAQNVLPQLKEAGTEFDKLTALMSGISPETRRTLASAIATVRPPLDQLINKALAVPGVGDVIRPTVDTIRASLDTLVTA